MLHCKRQTSSLQMACKVNVYISNRIRRQLRQQITIYHESAYIRRSLDRPVACACTGRRNYSLPRGSAATSIPAGKRKLHFGVLLSFSGKVSTLMPAVESKTLVLWAMQDPKALPSLSLSLSLSRTLAARHGGATQQPLRLSPICRGFCIS